MIGKKGLSGVIVVVILIAIVVASTAIIWKVINKTVEEGLGEAESCYDVMGKIEINSEYTCYDSDLDEVHFSVNIGDVEIEEISVVIDMGNYSESFTLTNEATEISRLRNYDGSLQVALPEKKSGSTYIASNFYIKPTLIQIAPTVNGNQCEVSDFLSYILEC